MAVTRRAILKTSLGAVAAATLSDRLFLLTADSPRRRYGASTTTGKTMLAKYAKAVGLMRDVKRFPPTDARNWNFQWYTHWVPGPQEPWADALSTKDKMIAQVFGSRPAMDPSRRLAAAMWDTCQAHGSNTADPNFFQEPFFCVWHRWYLYYFEDIIRGVLQDDSFTLPYWDYLSGNVKDLSLPAEFLDKSSPLYSSNRNQWVKDGERIDKGNLDTLNLDAFKETSYIGGSGVGFCPILDGNPHGLVHVYIGTPMNMGQVPFAANDPIFWVHHCNLDRLWESWNRLSGMVNPSWPGRKFTFADRSGTGVLAGASKADRVSLLHYDYDSYYLPSKPPVPPKPGLEALPVKVTRVFARAPIVLTSDRVTASLAPPTSPPQGRGPLESVTRASGPGRQLYLVLGNRTAPAGTAATYNVFWGTDADSNSSTKDPRFLGTLHFFGVTPDQHNGGSAAHELAFNVTGKIGAVTAGATSVDVTFVRKGAGGDTPPQVGQVALVEA